MAVDTDPGVGVGVAVAAGAYYFLTPTEFSSYMGGSTGTKALSEVQVAIDIAQGQVSEALGYPCADGGPTFLEQSWTETHKWPHPNRPLKLRRPRLILLSEVLALHDAGTCDCEWTELDGCAFIYDAEASLVKLTSCASASQCWCSCACPHRVQVTYTAGFEAEDVTVDTETGRRLRLAISLVAREILELLDFCTEGVAPIKSYSSMGYSESRDLARTTLGQYLGKGWLPEHAATLLKPLIIRRKSAIMIRSQ